MIPIVVGVKVIRPYVIEVTFQNGARRQVDLEPELHGKLFGPLRDSALFAQATVDPESETVVWPNGADFSPELLYELGRDDAGPGCPVDGVVPAALERSDQPSGDVLVGVEASP